MIRAASYTRVSTEDQIDGYSLDAQDEAIRRYAEFRGMTIVQKYVDPGRSGKNAQRPDFQRMLHDAELSAFDVILVHKLDRFSRKLADVINYLAALEKCKVSFVSVSEQFDFSTPSGKAMMQLLAVFSEWYLNNLREEVKKGKRERARQGGWNGTLSYGYTTRRKLETKLKSLGEQFKHEQIAEDDYARQCAVLEDWLEKYEGKEETTAIPHPVDWLGVVRAFSAYSTRQYSDAQIADLLNEEGYRISSHGKLNNLFGKETISDLLRNRFYIGETSYASGVAGSTARRKVAQYMEGDHEPLISHDLFERVQEVRADRQKRHIASSVRPATTFPLTGRLICLGCGAYMSGWTKESKGYYRQKGRAAKTCGQPRTVRSITIEAQIQSWLKGLKLPEDWRQQVVRLLGNLDDTSAQRMEQRTKLESRLSRLADLYELGDLTRAEYEAKRSEIKLKIAEIDAYTGAGNLSDYETTARLLKDVGNLWKLGSQDDRRVLARNLFVKIYVLDGAIKAVEPTKILWVLLSGGNLLRGEQGSSPQWVTVLPPETSYETAVELAS